MTLKTNREKLLALREYFQEKCEQAAKLEEAASRDAMKGVQCGRKFAYQNAAFMVQCLLDEDNDDYRIGMDPKDYNSNMEEVP